MGLEEYMDYWFVKKSDFGQVKRGDDDFADFLDEMERDGAVSTDKRAELVEAFANTDRGSINLCPGFEVIWSWPLSEAEGLDRGGEFVDTVREKIAVAMATWGQTL